MDKIIGIIDFIIGILLMFVIAPFVYVYLEMKYSDLFFSFLISSFPIFLIGNRFLAQGIKNIF